MKKVFMFLFLFSFLIGFSNNAKAAPTEVNTVAELKNLVENATEDIEIKLGDSFPKDQDITLEMNHFNLVKIDGNKENLTLNSEFTINLRKYHDEDMQQNLFEFENFHFDGQGKNDVGFSFGRFDDKVNHNANFIHIRHAIFENSTDSIITVKAPGVTQTRSLYISTLDLEIKNNKSNHAGAVFVDDHSSFSIHNSNIFNNVNASDEIGGGAISLIGSGTSLDLQYSRIENNKLTGTAKTGKELGGGAVYHEDFDSGSTTSFFNLFEGNETNLNESQNGGAIFIGKHLEGSYSQKFPDIRGTTFYKNKASGEGGAVAIDVTNANSLRFTFSDSLFYENSSKKNGGAFSMYSSKKISNYDDLEFKNVTFYKNSSGHTKGGALSLRNLDYEMPIESSIFFENTGKKNYENVVFEESNVKSTLNLGIDNGTVSEVKTEDVFGKYPVPLTSNRGRFEVGAAIDSKPLPTISVIPRFTNDANEVTKGLADLYKYPSNSLFSSDQRQTTSDFLTLGSVNNASILYDANEGNFNLPELKEFTGEEYYEGSKPKQYASLELPADFAFVKDGKEDLKVSRDGYEFKGWSTEKNGPIATDLQAGQVLVIQGQTKLYAVWQGKMYQTKYYGNGHTSGVAPKMTKSPFGENLKVKDANTLKRTGYSFIGWSEKATASKADPKYKPGADYKVKSKNNLYAVWQRDSNEVKYAANKATSGKAPKSAKVLYGNSVKLKTAGTLKRKGYTFTGWSTNKKATKAGYKVDKSLKIMKPTTLYAVWKKK